jgi:uncharacterized membrane-anchored protein
MNLELRKGYVFLPASEVTPILQKLNVAPPTAPILGAVTAEGAKPGPPGYWISVITEDPIGHVPESGADEIASMTFLDSVKQARPAAPALTAFAVTPSYTPADKALVWAERYGAKPPTPDLRHEQRLLGRETVAGVTTIGEAKALKKISKCAKDVMAMLSFSPGKTYADFVAGSDRTSEYDLPGLITGKRKAGPMAQTAPSAAPGAAPMTLADFKPGGKLQWVPWLGGGIVVLTIAYFAVSALRRRPGAPSGAVDDAPHDGDGNTA